MSRALCLAFAVFAAGCGHNPMASSAIPTAPVTVRAFDYHDQTQPVAGVAVLVNGQMRGVTDAGGTLVVAVVPGSAVELRVSKAGWTGLVPAAEGIVTGTAETWTFWLCEGSC